MNWRIVILAVAGLVGCQDDAAPTAAVPQAAIPAALTAHPGASHGTTGTGTTGSAALTQSTPKAGKAILAATPQADSLEGLTAEFPWGHGKDGVWSGTEAKDPETLAKISDADMLQRALGASEQIDREHALVSVGRRRLSGAFDAFRKGISHSEPLAVREMALSGLVEHGGSEALPLMWSILREDPSDQLRGQAIWAVSLYGADEARKAIDTGLADEDTGVRGMAVLAIWALKDRPDEAISLLESAAESDELRLYQEAFYNLSRMPWRRAGNLLLARARSTTGPKQRLALRSYRNWVRKFPDLR